MNEDHALQDQVHEALPQEAPSVEALLAEALPGDPPDDVGDGLSAQPTENGDRSEEEKAEPLSAPDETDPSADPLDPPSDPASDRLEMLTRELADLRELLHERIDTHERIAAERAEFLALYPDVPLTSLPDSVWEDVRCGVPLAAAYALSERKAHLKALEADSQNRANSHRSVGAHSTSGTDYFSPAEVRAMSAAEVSRNYSAIIRSMKKWNR
ncbi:MAG: hypothetical protein IJW16_01855 [Clostridia bacterium]|nr:hypothetical protein [Clostridia bacterium]